VAETSAARPTFTRCKYASAKPESVKPADFYTYRYVLGLLGFWNLSHGRVLYRKTVSVSVLRLGAGICWTLWTLLFGGRMDDRLVRTLRNIRQGVTSWSNVLMDILFGPFRRCMPPVPWRGKFSPETGHRVLRRRG
jgi:hypothetical protein